MTGCLEGEGRAETRLLKNSFLKERSYHKIDLFWSPNKPHVLPLWTFAMRVEEYLKFSIWRVTLLIVYLMSGSRPHIGQLESPLQLKSRRNIELLDILMMVTFVWEQENGFLFSFLFQGVFFSLFSSTENVQLSSALHLVCVCMCMCACARDKTHSNYDSQVEGF